MEPQLQRRDISWDPRDSRFMTMREPDFNIDEYDLKPEYPNFFSKSFRIHFRQHL
jgi:hypothetical protein